MSTADERFADAMEERGALILLADEQRKVAALYDAVRYMLGRVQIEPEFRFHMLHTEAFDQLCRAEAAVTGRSADEVSRQRSQDLQPEYRKRRPWCETERARVRELELLLEEHGIEVPPVREREEPSL